MDKLIGTFKTNMIFCGIDSKFLFKMYVDQIQIGEEYHDGLKRWEGEIYIPKEEKISNATNVLKKSYSTVAGKIIITRWDEKEYRFEFIGVGEPNFSNNNSEFINLQGEK